jgi:hypothetical protein
MFQRKLMLIVSTLVLVASTGVVRADDGLQARLDRAEARLAELEAQNNDNWLNERRAEEVKGLVHEVLADADTRASLLQDGAVAGHNGKNFFLGSADGSFLLKFKGQLQFRYLFNIEQANDDQQDEGFQMRRTKVGFSGHVNAGRKWDYTIVLAAERDGGSVFVEDAIIGTALKDDLRVDFGVFKLPFAREELNSSSRLMTVDRGPSTEYFTLNRSDQIQLTYTPKDDLKIAVSMSDGAQASFTEIGDNFNDIVEFAITGRVDYKVEGDWGQMKDYTAWNGEPKGVFIGGAVHYQAGDDRNNGGTDINYLAWTVDASLEMNKLGVAGALYGGHTDVASGTDRDMLGGFIMVNYLVKDDFEPFVRLDWIDDDFTDDDSFFVTLGFNYYMKKHNAKLTVDILWWVSGDDSGLAGNPFGAGALSDGLGWSEDDSQGEDSAVIRAQFQLLF